MAIEKRDCLMLTSSCSVASLAVRGASLRFKTGTTWTYVHRVRGELAVSKTHNPTAEYFQKEPPEGAIALRNSK
jgi:hypothetical protein